MIAVVVVVVIAVGVGAFFGGRATGGPSTQAASANGQANGQPGQMPTDGSLPSGTRDGSGSSRGDMISGSIIAADDSSITIKTSDGSSKIVLISDSTSISKTEDASKSDLITGEEVMVTGTSNEDGSVTATRVSLGASIPSGGTPPSDGTAPTGGGDNPTTDDSTANGSTMTTTAP
jgi:hypothetical protein